MASHPIHVTTSDAVPAQTARKKTPGACERCREKRVKCSGTHPCSQCSAKDVACVFSFAGGGQRSEVIEEKLDHILLRMERIEQSLNREGMTLSPRARQMNDQPRLVHDAQQHGVTQLNQHTGCFEYYGNTSTFVTVSSLRKRIKHLEQDQPSKRRRLDSGQGTITPPGAPNTFNATDLTGFYDYIPSANAHRQPRRLREDIADRHLDNFFRTIHIFIPIFNEDNLRARYGKIRSLFGDSRLFLPTPEDPTRRQFVCLLFSVLAMGALYEDEQEDTSSWAAWYFAEAQDMLGQHLDAINLELVQAAMLLGAYSQHAIKPNLAYVLTGLATRLAYSIGLNIDSASRTARFDVEEAKRTWWMVYIQEVELSLDSGRPMSIQTSRSKVDYPIVIQQGRDTNSADASQVSFIRYLAKVADIIRRVLELANDSGEDQIGRACIDAEVIRDELKSWRKSLPNHLQFVGTGTESVENNQLYGPYSWQARQQSSLRIHYNLALIILLRRFFTKIDLTSPSTYAQSVSVLQSVCLEAASDMIRHIHELFKIAPSLKRWSYYCFYCLQSTLILLIELVEGPVRSHPSDSDADYYSSAQHSQRRAAGNELELCEMSVEIFEQIELKASKRCAEVVKDFLEKSRKSKKPKPAHTSDHSPVRKSANTAKQGQSVPQRKRQTIAATTQNNAGASPAGSTYPAVSSLSRNISFHNTIATRTPTTTTARSIPDVVGGHHTSLREGWPRSPSVGQQEAQLYSTDSIDITSDIDGTSVWSPAIPFSRLQAELDDALHCTDDNDYGFLSQQGRAGFRFGTGIGMNGFLNMSGGDYLRPENRVYYDGGDGFDPGGHFY